MPLPQTLPSLRLILLEPFKGTWNKLLWLLPFQQHVRNSWEARSRTLLFSIHKGDPVFPLLKHEHVPPTPPSHTVHITKSPGSLPVRGISRSPSYVSHVPTGTVSSLWTVLTRPSDSSEPRTQQRKICTIEMTPPSPSHAWITSELDKYSSCLQMLSHMVYCQ